MRRNQPPALSEADIDRRISMMNRAFPDAMTEAPPPDLQDQMRADPKDKHVLAGAVHSESDVLVTDDLMASMRRPPARTRCGSRV